MASDGSHLIRTGTSGRDAVWYLFRADGGKLGELILPLSFQAKMMLPGAVVGVQIDEDDVESVVRYSFTVGR